MKKLILTMMIIFTGVVILAAGARAAGIKEGKWTMTMTTKMGGAMGEEYANAMKEMENMSEEEKGMMGQMMGNMGMQMGSGSQGITTTVTQCITNDNPVPEDPTKNCKETHSVDGNTVKFESVCDDSTSTGEITYQDESMTGTIKSKQNIDGQETDTTIELAGTYIGPCE